MDDGDSDGELTEIRQARLASRKAIDMLMADLKRKKKVNVWVPGGDQSTIFHTNAQDLLKAKRRYNSKKF